MLCEAALGRKADVKQHVSADLGGSSKYCQMRTLTGLKWRKVPCEQQLDMG